MLTLAWDDTETETNNNERLLTVFSLKTKESIQDP